MPPLIEDPGRDVSRLRTTPIGLHIHVDKKAEGEGVQPTGEPLPRNKTSE
jgi:hypothetical protein